MTAHSHDALSSSAVLRRMLPLVTLVFFGFLSIGVPLPALPLHVHGVLGFSPATVGWVIGIQSFATILSRKFAGTYCDRHGSRGAVLVGLPLASLAGLVYLASTWIPHPGASLAVLIAGRLLMGPAESLFLTGALTWGISRVGAQRTGLVMSWQGMAIFAALGLGAPIGVWAMSSAGFVGVSLASFALPLAGLAVALRLPATAAVRAAAGQALPFVKILGLIWRQGAALSLAASAYAILMSFVVLFFADRGWSGAGLALSGFAGGYIGVRIFCSKLPDRLGGGKVAAVSIGIEMLGQLCLWLAHDPAMALAGAMLTGAGFSLVLPSMGVEAMKRVPAAARGVAVGGFVGFFDITLGVTGPLAGVLIGSYGYQAAFLAGACLCAASCLMVLFGMGRQPA